MWFTMCLCMCAYVHITFWRLSNFMKNCLMSIICYLSPLVSPEQCGFWNFRSMKLLLRRTFLFPFFFAVPWCGVVNLFNNHLLSSDRVVSSIFKEIESHISKNTFLQNFKMKALPTLCEKFVELVGILVRHFLNCCQLHCNMMQLFWNYFPFTPTNKNKYLLQKDADPEKRGRVVLLLQDMLEVVSRDMATTEIRLVIFFYSY